MHGYWTTLALGFTVGVICREIVSGWLGMFQHLVAGLRSASLPPPEPVAAPAPEPVISNEEFTVVHGWAQLNPWYATDQALNMEAQIIHMALRNREPHLSLERNLAEVTAEMHRRHPEIIPTRQ
jgi:hypothetical protein